MEGGLFDLVEKLANTTFDLVPLVTKRVETLSSGVVERPFAAFTVPVGGAELIHRTPHRHDVRGVFDVRRRDPSGDSITDIDVSLAERRNDLVMNALGRIYATRDDLHLHPAFVPLAFGERSCHLAPAGVSHTDEGYSLDSHRPGETYRWGRY